MPRPLRSFVGLSAAFLLAVVAHAMTAGSLRVEYRERPIGLDVARPRLSWQLQAKERAQRQTAYQVLIASSAEQLAAGKSDIWDSGKIASSASFGIEYAGPALRSDTRYFWQVKVWDGADRPTAWSDPSWWQTGVMQAADWKAKWIGAEPTAGSPLLRRGFKLEKKVARATAHAYAAGWYRLFVNGTEVTERVLTPVNSNYPKGLFYDSYDVTALMQSGKNAVGLWLGVGYNQSYSKYGYSWDVPPAGLMQLELVYRDGTRETIATDGDWKWNESPVIANDIYHGETYDARRETKNWSRGNFDDDKWHPVVRRDAPPGPLKACPYPAIAVAADIRPVKIYQPKPGVYLFDLGQNIAGWVRLKLSADKGTTIVVRHAEELKPDGQLDVTTNRAARATDTYIAAGRNEEIYEPRFTYHGFRYVEVTGLTEAPTLDSVTGRAIRAAVEETGTFRCSDALLNRLHRNFRWTIANNLVGIPTDTATRDERTPCQMDSLAFEEAAMCNFGMAPYYTKWLNDIAGDGGNLPNWTGDQVILPFLLYQNYGDRRILEQHFDNMKQVVDKFTAVATETKYWADGFGDWATPNSAGSYEGSFSEGELVNTAFYYRTARVVADTATILGRAAEATQYSTLAADIRTHFATRFYRPDTATYGSGRQVTSVLPLAFDLVAPADRLSVASALFRRIEETDRSHLDTGIFGTRYLFETLIDHGFTELVHKVLTSPGYPGYPDQIAQGATTTWEQWSYAGSMQTHNHAMFSGPDATFFSHFGGIRAGTPGFREIVIRPAMPSRLTFVDCSRQVPAGKVTCRWERSGGRLTVRVAIPVNTTARIHIPARAAEQILESGKPLRGAPGILAVQPEGDRFVVTVGSGEYQFTTPSSLL